MGLTALRRGALAARRTVQHADAGQAWRLMRFLHVATQVEAAMGTMPAGRRLVGRSVHLHNQDLSSLQFSRVRRFAAVDAGVFIWAWYRLFQGLELA